MKTKSVGKFIYLGIFLASLDPTYQNAGDNARRAFLETNMAKQEMKQLQDEAERQLHIITGLTKEDLVYAAYAYPLVAGKVSTKPFKNFKATTKSGWTIRPEIEYQFNNQQSTTNLILTKEF
jgi:hypothetical protein